MLFEAIHRQGLVNLLFSLLKCFCGYLSSFLDRFLKFGLVEGCCGGVVGVRTQTM